MGDWVGMFKHRIGGLRSGKISGRHPMQIEKETNEIIMGYEVGKSVNTALGEFMSK